ncbi:DUF6444 domain-containing protein [Anoxybacillus sp. FSL W8-1294]|uniref:DUF6444 domain-containing protein n=1 Tax=Anoxybacillus sp. FSL W8-1294 TaxID=2954655 RepID=UPI0030D05A47
MLQISSVHLLTGIISERCQALFVRKENEQLKYRVQELEARTKKNSSNSHLPPSSDRFANTRSSRQPSGNKFA